MSEVREEDRQAAQKIVYQWRDDFDQMIDEIAQLCANTFFAGEARGIAERDAVVNAVLKAAGKRWRSMPIEEANDLQINGPTAAVLPDTEGVALIVVEKVLDKLQSLAFSAGLEAAAKIVDQFNNWRRFGDGEISPMPSKNRIIDEIRSLSPNVAERGEQ